MVTVTVADMTCTCYCFSFFVGIQFESSASKTKMVSAVEPAPANVECMQGTVCCDSFWSKVIVDVSYAWFCCLFFAGTEVNSSEQTIVSATEPAPANDEHMQGTHRHTLIHTHGTILGAD